MIMLNYDYNYNYNYCHCFIILFKRKNFKNNQDFGYGFQELLQFDHHFRVPVDKFEMHHFSDIPGGEKVPIN